MKSNIVALLIAILISTGTAVAAKIVVTKVAYDKIKKGMTYEEVCKIVGSPGEELSRYDMKRSLFFGGYTTVMYSWKNSNGSNMNAMFQKGQLILKAQSGLPLAPLPEQPSDLTVKPDGRNGSGETLIEGYGLPVGTLEVGPDVGSGEVTSENEDKKIIDTNVIKATFDKP